MTRKWCVKWINPESSENGLEVVDAEDELDAEEHVKWLVKKNFNIDVEITDVRGAI